MTRPQLDLLAFMLVHSSLLERKLSMNNDTHPDSFPTLPPPHGCIINTTIQKKYRAFCAVFAHYRNACYKIGILLLNPLSLTHFRSAERSASQKPFCGKASSR